MPSLSTTSLLLVENMRVTRSMSKLASQGCAGVIVRRPLSNRTTSTNSGTKPSAKQEASPLKPLVTKPAFSVPHPYKTGFGFVLRGAPRTPEERKRLRKERLAFFRRARAYKRKNLPKFNLRRAPAVADDVPYVREYVDERIGCYRIIPSPALLAPPATNVLGQILHRDTFTVVPEIREHAPPEWDEWRPRCHPDLDPEVDLSMLSVPSMDASGDFHPYHVARCFPILWRRALAEHTCEVRDKKKRSSKACTIGGRHRL
ncbi:hypothetical protein F5148DRAFT_561642 [Russula earlei]|uniref:Uncharacterized protein n=1 Tax=Russula earlei TaxID=71964 RepID=A0ACC0UNA6_9AGAM|nr:hypothetical protein F5148DRAFT_561642 [Russula earlei]